MKAKFYTAFLSALLLTGLTASGQLGDNRNFRNDEAGVVINNYYDDYDYYYSSRINRFHRSYAAFDYYSPVFTDTYWYNWQPSSWGVSIYGRSGFGFGYSMNYPIYNDWYGYDYGWYDPYYGSSWYWGYDPFYYSWYSPVIINFNVRNRWAYNSRGWYGHNHWYNDYRPVYNSYNSYNNYSGTRYSSREFSGGRSTPINRTNSGGVSRRQSVPVSGRDNNPAVNNRTNMGAGNDSRRTGNSDSNRGQGTVNNSGNGNNGNNRGTNNGNNQNSRLDGNNGNFDQNTRNTNNNGNNRNSQTDGNNGNFNNRNNGGEKGNATSPASVPATRRYEQTAPARTQNNTSNRPTFSAPRSSSSSRSGAAMSQGRSSSSSSRSGSSVSRSSSSSSRSSGSSSKSSGSSSSSRSRRK
jgi:hypothetical protein